MNYPRGLAVRVLTQVLAERRPLDETLQALAGGQTPQARAWLQEVCAGTLRWKGRLDLAVDSVALKKKPSGWLRRILLVSSYQLIVQERTQPAAVVSETVDEIRKAESDAPAKFANAALRKISEHGANWRTLPFPAKALTEERAAWASLPSWLWKKIDQDHGTDWARAFAQACLERPKTWIRKQSATAGPVPGAECLTEGGAITEREGFSSGDFFVQDISSQLLVHEISEHVRKAVGENPAALDLCAAPGGKAAGLAWNGFDVTATDREERRLHLLKDTVSRIGKSSKLQVIPREKVANLPEQDLVWVDAPCSGTGIIRRHPDVRWLRQEKELTGLTELQKSLIQESWTKVKAGGFLAYSVCSVLNEEGPGAIDASGVLASGGIKVREWLLSPHLPPHGDGFYAVLIRKP